MRPPAQFASLKAEILTLGVEERWRDIVGIERMHNGKAIVKKESEDEERK